MGYFLVKIRQIIQTYFSYSEKEANGFVGMIVLMILILFVPLVVQIVYQPKVDIPEFINIDFDKLEKTRKFSPKDSLEDSQEKIEEALLRPLHIKTFDFDPNTTTEAEFVSLGIDKKVARRIINFRNKGGKFKIKKDLKKIFGIDTHLVNDLNSHILLPDTYAIRTKMFEQKSAYSYVKKEFEKIDINVVDSLSLEKIRGIGPKLASRIIKYRNKLGGFVSMEQIKEIYGLDTLVVSQLLKQTFIKPDFHPKLININACTFDDLKNHPYFGYKLAKLIIAYRQMHGAFLSKQDLLKIKEMDYTQIEKFEHYLTFVK
ncbi:MAG: helix-hairpin-helix domain-containing protein [Bacteroidota bacterium]|nr:helix-hairpin-helix domain-containing protein [Bacteroidota bacterium]